MIWSSIELCYLSFHKFFELKEEFILKCKNDLHFKQHNEKIRVHWKKATKNLINDSFFNHTDLLFFLDDFIFLKTINNEHSLHLVNNYVMKAQVICIEVFQEEKNIVLISEEQLFNFVSNEKLFVLFKNKNTAIEQLIKKGKEDLASHFRFK